MLINQLTTWWRNSPMPAFQEGVYADQYQDTEIRTQITEQYRARWQPAATPASRPELFDPLVPPPGWRYDPYYECWIDESQ